MRTRYDELCGQRHEEKKKKRERQNLLNLLSVLWKMPNIKLLSSRHNKNRSNALNFLDCVDNADKWREDKMFCLIPTLLVGNWGRQRWRSDLTVHKKSPAQPQITNARYFRTSATAPLDLLLFPDLSPSLLVAFICTNFHITASLLIFFFFSVHKLININYILHFMPHLRSKCAFYQRQVVKVRVDWADPPPSPAWPSWRLGSSHGKDSDGSEKGCDDLC